MARSVIAALLLGGCFHAPAYSPQRSVATWREMQSAAPAGATSSRADAGGDALTADEAYAYALRNNPELAVAEAEAEVIAAEVDAAKQIDNPQLRLTNFGVDDAVRGAPGLNLALRAPIPRPGTVRARAEGARLAAEAAQGQTEAARRLLRAEIDRLYARLAMLRADLEEVTRAASLGDERHKQIRERVERQVGTRVDLALADLARAEALDEASQLRDELATTEAELARVIGPGAPRKYHVDPNVL
ncbi:MAG TPA: TolC family protein, partial [Nannocystis sp.]